MTAALDLENNRNTNTERTVAMNNERKRIFVASPLRGDIEANIARAERLCKRVAEMGHAPFAPHLLYTRFLDDSIESERNCGIECGLRFLDACDELWAFGAPTAGMSAEIAHAQALGIPVRVMQAIL